MLHGSRLRQNYVLSFAVAASAVLLGASITAAQPAQAPAPSSPPPNQSAQAPVPLAPASTPEQEKLRVVPAGRLPGKVHILPATLQTTTWGLV